MNKNAGNKSSELNLARKHRPSQFEAIIGQTLTVSLLKNSLYRQQFFPVYLLVGQRGCGKTTTGRVFAAALNCSKLDDFSKNPKIIVPCGECASCVAMRAGKHPDFIEIDAASHTGVDNIRQIIEGSSFLPQLGRKKIYLIDEAHMLSKAAFNALLKILEEPPLTVTFMMATTDPHKIIDTVRSRCFQLFFEPVAHETLVNYLGVVCEQEGLVADKDGLALVAWESEGSVRDALNIIERIRLAHNEITQASVMATLGHLDDDVVISLVECVAQGDTAGVINLLHGRTRALAATVVWKKLFEIMRAVLIVRFSELPGALLVYKERLDALAAVMAPERCIAAMEMLYTAEQQFLKTTSQQELLELLLIKMCLNLVSVPEARQEIKKPTALKQSVSAVAPKPVSTPVPVKETMQVRSTPTVVAPVASSVYANPDFAKASPGRPGQQAQSPLSNAPEGSPEALWHKFVAAADKLSDPLLVSILKQGRFVEADASGNKWRVALSKEMVFFQDTLAKTAEVWQKALDAVCERAIVVEFTFVDVNSAASTQPIVRNNNNKVIEQRPVGKKPALDLQDASKWDTTHTLLRMFPGTVSEIKDPAHE